jgi:Zn-dependent peptidase ImmA (M78 family)
VERGFKSRCENLALQVRSDLKLDTVAPLPAQSLAKQLGVQLLSPQDIRGLSSKALHQLGKDTDSWSAVTVTFDSTEVVIYNNRHARNRQSSDIMHELSHIILGHKPIEMMLFSKDLDIVLRDFNEDAEEEAKWLSGCLLLPREALIHIRKHGMDEQTVKDTYQVSSILFHFRMNMTGVEKQVRSISR